MDVIADLTQATGLSGWLPAWLIVATIIIGSAALGLLLHRLLFRLAIAGTRRLDSFWQALLLRTQGPTRLAFTVLGVRIGTALAPVGTQWAAGIHQVLLVATICLLGWIAVIASEIWLALHLRRFRLDAEDNLLARKHVTQSRILRRVVAVLIVLITLSAALMTFDGVRQYGISLLASAGAAGLVLGLALQPLLKNLIAGVQLAITQPIRIDDALLVENEWGNVEEITATYVVVRLWDWRRMVLPLSYFIEKPFQNWTREGASLIGTVMIYLDYSVPVEAIRRKVEEIARRSPLWDRNVINVQVTDFKQMTMEVRILVSASNAPSAFDLRCEVREKLIGYIQEEFPGALPRLRTETPRMSNAA